MIPTVKFPGDKFSQPQASASTAVSQTALQQAFARSLTAAIDYPPFDQVVFTGDRVALAVLDSLQHPRQCLEAAVLAMASLTADLDLVVVAREHPKIDWQDFESRMTEATQTTGLRLSVCQHDPADQNAVACIAINEAGEPIFINRSLFDADVVIPIGSFLPNDLQTAFSIFPQFSTSATIARFRKGKTPAAELAGEIACANQNIGAGFAILVVSGPGGSVQGVYCGDSHSVLRQAADDSDDGWNFSQMADGEVVVATIESAASGQTWDQFFRAVLAAATAAANVRQIVVCTELKELPAAAQRRIFDLQFESDQDVIRRRIAAVPEWMAGIPDILRDISIYLKSSLGQSQVEELGLGHIESDKELQRIIDQAQSGLVLRDAHLCKIT